MLHTLSIYQITPIHTTQLLTNHRLCGVPNHRLHWSGRRKVLSFVATASTQRLTEQEEEEASESFNFDHSFESSEKRRFESPKVDVKEIDDLPEQWRRSKLAWLCKELPSHRSGTFLRVLNARRKWIKQDDCTYVAVHFMRIRENEAAFRVYKWMMQQQWAQFDFALATRLADYMGKERKPAKSREIFDDIVNRGLIPNESTFYLLIVAYLSSSSSSSCLEEACSIYNQMIHLGGYKPPLSLHNALFRALLSKPGGSCKHHLQQAEFIFHNLMADGFKIHSDIYGGLIWLHSYQDVIDRERIESLRAELKSIGVKESVEVLVSVLRACSKDGDLVEEAEKTWKSILSLDSKPPSEAFLYLMEAYSKAGEVMKSLQTFRDMHAQGLSTVVSRCKIIEILCKAREIDHVESLMEEFTDSGIEPSIRSCIDLMNLYFDLNLHDKVESTFFRCLENSSPNHTLCSIYLDSLVADNNLAEAGEIFRQMYLDETVGIDSRSCNTLLRGYLASEKHHLESVKIYELMCQKEYKVEPSLKEKLERVLSLFREEAEKSLKLSLEQREMLTGLLLGGLRVRPGGANSSKVDFIFREGCNVHSSLKRHIYNQFHEWLSSKPNNDGGDIPNNFSTVSHLYFKFYSDVFYPQGRPAVPKLIHRWLSPLVLAYWYMYGGYRTSSGDILLKLKFGEEDVARVVRALKVKSLNCRVKRKGSGFWVGFLGGDAVAFWGIIEPFVLAGLSESLRAGFEPSEEKKNGRCGGDQHGNAHVSLSSHEK